MWFPNEKKVAQRLEELIEEFTCLNERIKHWHGFYREMLSSGLGGMDGLSWASDALDLQEYGIDSLRRAAVALEQGDADWREILESLGHFEKPAKSLRRFLDKMDRQFEIEKKRSAARMRAWGIGPDA